MECIVLAALIGVLVGITVENKINPKIDNDNKRIIKNLEELVELYDSYCEDLCKYIDLYEDGINETLKENIELKKRIKVYE